MNETVQNTNYNLGFSLTAHSPVGSPQCRRLGCWPGSTGPHPWRARSSGASRCGRPRSCHRGGRSSTSAPGPAGGEARLVTRSGALRETDTVGADAAPWLHMTLTGYCRSFFSLSNTWKTKWEQTPTMVCRAVALLQLLFLVLCVVFGRLAVCRFGELLPHQVGH